MKTIKLFFIIVLLLSIFIGNNSCNQFSKNKNDVLKIGAVLPLTGNLGFLGESAKTGLDFASFYFNKIDSTRKVEFYIEDGQGNPTISINAINKLVNINNVNIIFSTISAVELSIIPIQQRDSFLFFSHSTHPKLSNVNSLVFRHSPTVLQEVELINNKISSEDRIAVCYMIDDYGVSFEELIQKNSNSKNLNSFGFQKGETNFNSVSQKIVESNPDKIILCAGGSNLSSLIKKIRELNCDAQIITTLAFTVSGASKNLENMTSISMINFKPIKAQTEFITYLAEYESLKGKKLSTSELLFFNSALLIYKCSSKSKKVNDISIEIKSKQEWELLGESAKILTSNDILPNLEFIEK